MPHSPPFQRASIAGLDPTSRLLSRRFGAHRQAKVTAHGPVLTYQNRVRDCPNMLSVIRTSAHPAFVYVVLSAHAMAGVAILFSGVSGLG